MTATDFLSRQPDRDTERKNVSVFLWPCPCPGLGKERTWPGVPTFLRETPGFRATKQEGKHGQRCLCRWSCLSNGVSAKATHCGGARGPQQLGEQAADPRDGRAQHLWLAGHKRLRAWHQGLTTLLRFTEERVRGRISFYPHKRKTQSTVKREKEEPALNSL